MKKILLLLFSLVIMLPVLAYETVLVDFPTEEGWHPVYYEEQGSEAILQYVPRGETYQKWSKTLIFHSYKNPTRYSTATSFMDMTAGQMELKNSSQVYKYLKYTDVDSIATRCVQKNLHVPTQCEIYRVSTSYEGLISMHYINKSTQDFKANYDKWLNIVRNIRIYYNYYRNDRILNKATIFEI